MLLYHGPIDRTNLQREPPIKYNLDCRRHHDINYSRNIQTNTPGMESNKQPVESATTQHQYNLLNNRKKTKTNIRFFDDITLQHSKHLSKYKPTIPTCQLTLPVSLVESTVMYNTNKTTFNTIDKIPTDNTNLSTDTTSPPG